MFNENPATLTRLLPATVSSMLPPARYLVQFLSDVPLPDWPLIADDLKSTFSMKPSASANTPRNLRAIDRHLSSFQDAVPTPATDGADLLSVDSALARVTKFRALLLARSDFGSSGSSSSAVGPFSSVGGA